MVLSAEIELKLHELTVVDYDHRYWSWLLDPNRTPMPLVLLKAPGSAKSLSAVVMEMIRVPGRVVLVKRKKAPAQPSGSLLPEEVALE